jgi:hypothetical protein
LTIPNLAFYRSGLSQESIMPIIYARFAIPFIFFATTIPLLAQTRPANQAAQGHYQTPAEAGLKFINNPGGGQIFYGVLANESTMNGAMIAMLRSVHGYFGVRPEIGQFFQAKGSDSIATFFTLSAKVQGGGMKAISGLVIVSMPQGSKPLGGAMFDDVAHFSRTQPVMMKTLNEAWRADAAKSAPAVGGGPVHSGEPQTLRQATAGDGSASIGLAPGWKLTGVAGGYLSAEGPNGEMIDIDGMFQQIHDPRAQNQRQYGNGPMLVAPMGGDLFSAYASLVNQGRQNKGKSPATFHLISSKNIPPQAVEAIFELDLHDGKGMRKGSVRLDPIYTRGLPTWALSVTASNAPESVFEASNPIIMAMVHSYSQDRAVIGREQKAVIDNIHAIGERSKQQAADADARRVASSQAFNQHMDNIDRQSKAFQNYQFDSSQLQVTNGSQAARGTVSNGTAAALVQADPNHFQIVPTQDFIKGVDY